MVVSWRPGGFLWRVTAYSIMALLAVHHRTGTVSLGNAVYSWGMLSAQQGGAPTFLQAPLDSADGVSRGPGACQSFVGGQQHQTCRFGQLDVEGIGQAEVSRRDHAPASSDERPCRVTGTCRNSSSAAST